MQRIIKNDIFFTILVCFCIFFSIGIAVSISWNRYEADFITSANNYFSEKSATENRRSEIIQETQYLMESTRCHLDYQLWKTQPDSYQKDLSLKHFKKIYGSLNFNEKCIGNPNIQVQ